MQVHKSTDNGNSWKIFDQLPVQAAISVIAFDPSNISMANYFVDTQDNTIEYMSPYFRQVKFSGKDANTVYLTVFTGLFKTTIDGQGWVELETLPVSLIKSLALLPVNQDGDYSVAIGTYGGGAYISHDGGNNWFTSNKGLNTTRLGDIVFTPSYADDNTIYTGSNSLLLKSTDRDTTWDKTPLHYKSVKKSAIYKLISLGMPHEFGRIFLTKAENRGVYPSPIALSPSYLDDNTTLFGTSWRCMYRSEDVGESS